MIKSINDINRDSEDGELLFAAIVKITTESQTDKTPDEVIQQLNELALDIDNNIYKPQFNYKEFAEKILDKWLSDYPWQLNAKENAMKAMDDYAKQYIKLIY
jgi:hypothetical protein